MLSATPLVSLPGYRSDVQVGGARLLLWGNLLTVFWKEDLAFQLHYDQSGNQAPFPVPPLLESSVVLHHASKPFDLDLTLKRGRIVILNTNKGKKPLRVRLRFDNPTNPSLPNVWDVELPYQDCEIALERWCYYPFTESFVEDRKSPHPGPEAHVELYCLKGEARVKIDGNERTVEQPVGFSRLVWTSRRGKVSPALAMEKLPAWVSVAPPGTPLMNEKDTEMLRGADAQAGRDLKGGNVDIVLKNAMTSNPLLCTVAVRCLAALGDDASLGRLIDALEDADNYPARIFAIDSLRYWIAQSRDNDYRLYDLRAYANGPGRRSPGKQPSSWACCTIIPRKLVKEHSMMC